MTRLVLHTDAIEDLTAIRDSGAIADFGVIVAFLQQAKQDMALLETLAVHWFGEDGTANHTVSKVAFLHRRGKRVWRLKVLTIKGLAVRYRLLYAFDEPTKTYYLLGVPPREIAYDEHHPRTQRLIAAYDKLPLR